MGRHELFVEVVVSGVYIPEVARISQTDDSSIHSRCRLGDVETSLPLVRMRRPTTTLGIDPFISLVPLRIHALRLALPRTNTARRFTCELVGKEEETVRARFRPPGSRVERTYEDAEYEHVGKGGDRVYPSRGARA